ncbi:MAG: response regulator [Spirochaetes bacterium]|nr:response regulator [Spirochaetota bacterium]
MSSHDAKKILLADDDDLNLLFAKNILKNKYEVITAKSGQEALDYLLKGFVPHIILLDVIMPDMDGWETYRKIRGISLLQDVPIAFLTHLQEKEDMKKAYKMGAADYIMKPYEKNDLLERIENTINKHYKK